MKWLTALSEKGCVLNSDDDYGYGNLLDKLKGIVLRDGTLIGNS